MRDACIRKSDGRLSTGQVNIYTILFLRGFFLKKRVQWKQSDNLMDKSFNHVGITVRQVFWIGI